MRSPSYGSDLRVKPISSMSKLDAHLRPPLSCSLMWRTAARLHFFLSGGAFGPSWNQFRCLSGIFAICHSPMREGSRFAPPRQRATSSSKSTYHHSIAPAVCRRTRKVSAS